MTSHQHKQFRLCCNLIMQDYKHNPKALNYAYGYAQAGLHLYEPESIRVQILYILNNLTTWRGDLATKVRRELKDLSRDLGEASPRNQGRN